MFLAGFAQPRGQVHQARRDDAALGVDHAFGCEVCGGLAQRHNAARCNRHIGVLIQTAGRVDHAAVLNE